MRERGREREGRTDTETPGNVSHPEKEQLACWKRGRKDVSRYRWGMCLLSGQLELLHDSFPLL